MAVDIPSGYAQVRITYNAETLTDPAYTVLGFNLGGDPDLETLAQAVYNGIETHLAPELHDSYDVTEVMALSASFSGTASGPAIQGTRTGALAPPNVALLVKKVTQVRGHAHRGRMYLPGFLLDENINDSGGVTDLRRVAMQSVLDDFFGDLFTINYAGVILHNSGAIAPTPISSYTVEPLVATQRRRLR